MAGLTTRVRSALVPFARLGGPSWLGGVAWPGPGGVAWLGGPSWLGGVAWLGGVLGAVRSSRSGHGAAAESQSVGMSKRATSSCQAASSPVAPPLAPPPLTSSPLTS